MPPEEVNAIIRRLDKFEVKLDDMAKSLLDVVRVEERQSQCQIQCTNTTSALWKKYDDMAKRVGAIEISGAIGLSKIGVGERVFWLMVSGGLSAFLAIKVI